jgi:molybdopterin-biosynthesis enzyme MoeA-like protein
MLLPWHQGLIIAMPGPPSEMRPMFEASVAPLLKVRWAGWYRVEIAMQTNVADESLLNPLFEQVMAMVPGSYLKADPKGFGSEVRLDVYLSGEGASEAIARSIVQQARDQLTDALESLGYELMGAE